MALRRKKSEAPDGGAAEKTPGRIAQLRQAYTFTRKSDPKLPLILLGTFFGPLVVGLGIGIPLGIIWLDVLGVAVGIVVTMAMLTRRVQKATFASVAGQPGIAAAVVEQMRGDWRVTPAVQLNRDQGMVHRVLGKPGVVLLAEGKGARTLMTAESRRLRKVVGETPLHTFVVGDAEGETHLDKLQMSLTKLPRTLKGGQVDALDKRLKALPAGGPALPLPKGPVPTRVPRGARGR